jgi:hypothetical protein
MDIYDYYNMNNNDNNNNNQFKFHIDIVANTDDDNNEPHAVTMEEIRKLEAAVWARQKTTKHNYNDADRDLPIEAIARQNVIFDYKRLPSLSELCRIQCVHRNQWSERIQGTQIQDVVGRWDRPVQKQGNRSEC